MVLGGLFDPGGPAACGVQRELAEAKAVAEDDLIALNSRITDHQNDVSVRSSPEAAAEQAAALAAYEEALRPWKSARWPRTCGQ